MQTTQRPLFIENIKRIFYYNTDKIKVLESYYDSDYYYFKVHSSNIDSVSDVKLYRFKNKNGAYEIHFSQPNPSTVFISYSDLNTIPKFINFLSKIL